jgi:hypothetical protein
VSRTLLLRLSQPEKDRAWGFGDGDEVVTVS